MKSNQEPKLFRLIDANLNRLKEGIRVVEDIERYIFDNKELASKLKNLRHQAQYEDKRLLLYRDIRHDVLKESTQSELLRDSIQSILKANIKRAQESARVLEEAMKMVDLKWSERFKNIRYELYDVEKEL
ncbi:MAG: thiamine-phosphate pyrophosphorylase [Epsilonproteobacteria bacterium]|nr:thiamine-phosphate pyrophosphorylase [Campylobacterota bacterium]NPA63985.1 thiamine-phosphate pyrophosphorylase [Campylobacterota bacterium]